MNLLPIDENSAEGWHKHPLWCIPSKDSGKPVSMRGADICTFSDKEKQMLVSITFADFGIASFHSISFADYKRNKAVSVRSFKRPSTKASRLSDSAVSDCSLTYYDNDLTISILKRKEHRHILMTAPELMLPSGESLTNSLNLLSPASKVFKNNFSSSNTKVSIIGLFTTKYG